MSGLLVGPVMTTNGYSPTLPSQSGRLYQLQYQATVGSNWISLPLIPGNRGMLTLTDPAPTDTTRFYRVLRW
jgi:hypothetical protein